jgi:hypothetical protein
VSIVALVLIAAAVALLAVAEWPRVSRRFGVDARQSRERARRKKQWRVVSSAPGQRLSESDEFARAVERDLAALPTIDERDAKKG